jgi:hypothetical protein
MLGTEFVVGEEGIAAKERKERKKRFRQKSALCLRDRGLNFGEYS